MNKAVTYALFRNHPKLQRELLLRELWPTTQSTVWGKAKSARSWRRMKYNWIQEEKISQLNFIDFQIPTVET